MLKNLRDALNDAARMFETSGAKAAATDYKALEQSLVGDASSLTDDAIGNLRVKLDAEKARVRDLYVSTLRSSLSNELAFAATAECLGKDKSISKEDMDHIAHTLTGGREHWPTRKAALDAIKKYFVECAYRDAKLRSVEKAKVW